MGLLAATAFILATQTAPKDERVVGITTPPPLKAMMADEDRLDEIWDHVDNRVIRQLDVWFDTGEFPSSVSLLRVQYAYDPNDYETVTNLGWMMENTDLLEESRATYLGYLKAHPGNGDAAFPLGMSYYLKKEYEKAIPYLEASLANKPGPNTYRVLAKSYERIKKYSDAIRIWELELKQFPGEDTAVANIKRVKAKIAAGGGKATRK